MATPRTCNRANCTNLCHGYNGECRDCGKKLTALRTAAEKVIKARKLTVDRAGCAFWVWDAVGNVVVTGRNHMVEVWAELTGMPAVL